MSNERVKVEGEKGLFRDLTSGGVVSDNSAYARYKEEKEKKLKMLSQETKINNLYEEVNDIKAQLAEILSILRSV